MKNRSLTILFICVLVLVFAAAVSADQDGNASWCNMDKYGCYNTEEDGSKSYIYFWSEEARAYFMGNSTAPYTSVVDYCYDCEEGKMGGGGSGSGAISNTFRKLLSGKWVKSSGSDSHGKYSGDTYNGYYDDGSLEIIQNWNYKDGGRLEGHYNVTGYDDDDGEAWVEGTETYTDATGNSATKTY